MSKAIKDILSNEKKLNEVAKVAFDSVDTDKSGHLYLICTIKNENGINSVMNEGNIMDLSTAYNKIPAFSFICEE